jgi:hypothetical protein
LFWNFCFMFKENVIGIGKSVGQNKVFYPIGRNLLHYSSFYSRKKKH